MECCAKCFDDRWLDELVISRLSQRTGTCSFCGSNNVQLVKPQQLRDSFELLIDAYIPDENGKTLVEHFKTDWAMFSHSKMDNANASALLAEILDDGNITRKRFSSTSSSATDSLGAWSVFKNELMHENRFFPAKEMNRSLLTELLVHLVIKINSLPNHTWYRARIQRGNNAFLPTEMGAPPKELATHGRANPVGIPYLYLASEPNTAVSEIRPHTGENICVAEFKIEKPLDIIDLRNPRNAASPFRLDECKKIVALRGDIEFLVQLGRELTRPVLPHAAAIDYLPSQYLCEFIKSCGYHGVLYKSSVGNGINLAVFDPSCAIAAEVSQYCVSKVTVDISSFSP